MENEKLLPDPPKVEEVTEEILNVDREVRSFGIETPQIGKLPGIFTSAPAAFDSNGQRFYRKRQGRQIGSNRGCCGLIRMTNLDYQFDWKIYLTVTVKKAEGAFD